MRQRGSKPEYQIKIAKERIEILFDEAEKAGDKQLRNAMSSLPAR